MSKAPIAVALDGKNLATISSWAFAVAPFVSTLKVGLETYLRDGAAAIETVRATGCDLFLDLKLHDIPNTVAGAARSAAALEPAIFTVHASGSPTMVAAAAQALPRSKVAAVTVLTSLSDTQLQEMNFGSSASEQALLLARLSVEAGARAIVCSPSEVKAMRSALGGHITLITPGVRPAGAALDDQSRVATPQQALADGADLLVVGRPITGGYAQGGIDAVAKAAEELAASIR